MKKEEFDRDLDDYLRTRHKARSMKDFITGVIDRIKPQPRPEVELHESVELYEENHHENKRKSFWTKEKEEPANEQLLRAQMQADDAVTDMKEIAKIALKAVKQLPDDKLHDFKQSDDFTKLRTVLKKHDLIK